MTFPLPYDEHALPDGVCSRFIQDVNGLTLHILEAGDADPNRPAVLLLHGFPELAYSWRRVMPVLAEAGYYVIAPDQRGYGRTMGWSDEYDADLGPYRLLNLVRDMLSLIKAVGRDHVNAVIGHDFGASVAAYAALIRPDVFRAMTLMSAPFAGPTRLGSGATGFHPCGHDRSRSTAQTLPMVLFDPSGQLRHAFLSTRSS